jgi:hypothetical protein
MSHNGVWKPTPRQRRVLEAAQKVGLDRTITAVCNEAGVNRRTFYRWLEKNKDFHDAWDNVWRRTITKYMPSVVAAMASKAKKGNVSAAKLLADLSGKLTKQFELTHKGQVTIETIEVTKTYESE